MQVKNNYQMEWKCGRYGIPVDKGVGVFNGDTGILRFNEFAEMGLFFKVESMGELRNTPTKH